MSQRGARVRVETRRLNSNMQPMTKFAYAQTRQVWDQAIKEFVDTLVDLVRVDTGMSVHTVQPLAAEVRASFRPKGPKSDPKEPLKSISGHQIYYPFREKSPEAGIYYGRQGNAYSISYGSVRVPLFRFWFAITTYQWAQNENNWVALKKAQEAFEISFRAGIKRIQLPLAAYTLKDLGTAAMNADVPF